jgi:glycosidase
MRRISALLLVLSQVSLLPLVQPALAAANAVPPAGAASGDAVATATTPFLQRPSTDEFIYFLLPDRFENGDPANDVGGLKGDRLATGFDPSHKGYFHGGDLKGLVQRLDYIQGLGATAIWLGPIYQNKAVQGPVGDESAGYHGYWITDFTKVDAHYGTNEEMKAFVDAAHARGIKVYLDIITNHTADVITYRECPRIGCPYRSKADYPGQAYEAYVPADEENVKVPAWLNDVRWYHNRGNTTFEGENSQLGDFFGLDDLDTDNPRVVQGFIDIYGDWITKFRVDGFRIDTAKHVNPEFWQEFAPAMEQRARLAGIPNFHIFGEVATGEMDPALTARWTRIADLPSVLDFGFAAAVRRTLAGNDGTDLLARLFEADVLYAGGEAQALTLPTFISNHDDGRLAYFIQRARPKATNEEVLARMKLGHALLLLLRGVPTVYYGDEQGFVGYGNDQAARQDMFPSRTASYNKQPLLGTTATTAASNFDTAHPLYRLIQQLAGARAGSDALQSGRQVPRHSEPKPGLFAVSRFSPTTGKEVLLAFNTSAEPLEANVVVERGSRQFHSLVGACGATAHEPGSYRVKLPAFGFVACAAE